MRQQQNFKRARATQTFNCNHIIQFWWYPTSLPSSTLEYLLLLFRDTKLLPVYDNSFPYNLVTLPPPRERKQKISRFPIKFVFTHLYTILGETTALAREMFTSGFRSRLKNVACISFLTSLLSKSVLKHIAHL